MMKLVYSSIIQSRRSGFSKSFRVLLYSTATLASIPPKDTLYKRITPIGDPRISIVPVLDKWIEEGKRVKKAELQLMIKGMRALKRFGHALEISRWMSDNRYFELLPGDVAIRLDLISKVHGLEEAEKYFNDIPNQLRVLQVYGALLHCYTHEKSVEKAEALMQKMKELGFATGSLSYNVLLNLYLHAGKHEKLNILMQEMEEKGICLDKFTYTIRLSAFVSASDLDGMEKIMERMEKDPQVLTDWRTCTVAANGYLKAGLIGKALAMLKKSEEMITVKNKRVAYEFLLSSYASMGKIDELYRIWKRIKSTEKVYNATYMRMISSLVKLDNIGGAEKILKEWESGCTSYAFRVPNLLISAYCKKGLLERAEAYINRMIGSGKKPPSSTWMIMANGYREDHQMQKAVDTMKKAISVSRLGWKPNCFTLAACVEYLRGKGDFEVMEEFISLLWLSEPFPMDICDKLSNNLKDEPGSNMLDLMEGLDLDADGEKLKMELMNESTQLNYETSCGSYYELIKLDHQ